MTVSNLPRKAVCEWSVYVPGERVPSWVKADEWALLDGHVLQFTCAGKVVAVFHSWDLFERCERAEGEGT